jgi:hypothetical protein
VKVSKLWDNPAAKPFRDWVATQKDGVLEAMVGVPFGDIDRVTVVVPVVDPREDAEEPITVVTTRQKYTDSNVLKALAGGLGDGKELQLKGRAVRLPRGNSPFRTALLVNDRTLAFTSKGLDEKEAAAVLARLAPRKGNGPLAGALAEAQTHDVVAAMNVTALKLELDTLAALLLENKEFAPFLVLLKAKTAVLTADAGKTAKGKLVMAFPDADTAKQAAKALEEGMKMIAAQFPRDRPRGEPVEKFIAGRVVEVMKGAKVTVDGSNVVVAADVPFADDLEKLVAALPKSLKEYILETTALNNLKQLGIGMHNYNDATGKLPGDVGPGDKAPAMSWRVQILPFIEQDNLAKQLDLTKPWDDPANLKILQEAEMPKVFEHPGRPAPKGHTYYRIFSLPKNAKAKLYDWPLFKEGERGPTIPRIIDGTSNTFMIVEAGEAVPWYKPDVLAYDGKLPLPQLGDKNADVFLVVFCDGSVRKFKPSKLSEKTLRALITPAGDETIPDLDK